MQAIVFEKILISGMLSEPNILRGTTGEPILSTRLSNFARLSQTKHSEGKFKASLFLSVLFSHYFYSALSIPQSKTSTRNKTQTFGKTPSLGFPKQSEIKKFHEVKKRSEMKRNEVKRKTNKCYDCGYKMFNSVLK